MALGIFAASQGDICAIIQTECYVFIPDESANVSCLLITWGHNWTPWVIPTPSLEDSNWFRSQNSWWTKLLPMLGIIVLACIFSGMCLYCCCCICLQCSQIATKWVTSKLVKSLADSHQGTLREQRVCEIVRAGQEGHSIGGGHQEEVSTSWPENWT